MNKLNTFLLICILSIFFLGFKIKLIEDRPSSFGSVSKFFTDSDKFFSDLIVSNIEITGDKTSVDGLDYLPVQVVVSNRGKFPVNQQIRLGAEVSRQGQPDAGTPFTVPGQASRTYPKIAGLEPGASTTVSGRVGVRSLRIAGNELPVNKITIFVDYCGGIEFSEPHCQVKESNEENNHSSIIVNTPASNSEVFRNPSLNNHIFKDDFINKDK